MDAERELELEIDAGRARYLFRKEHDLRVALEARVAELEAVLEEAEHSDGPPRGPRTSRRPMKAS